MPASIVARSGSGSGSVLVSYDFHLLPSGLVNPHCLNFIGTGVVVHVPTFFSELEKDQSQGHHGCGAADLRVGPVSHRL